MKSLDELSTFYKLDKNIVTKCHNYIPNYVSLFETRRDSISNVFEIGIGSVENNQMSGVWNLGYKTGNSLRCWRDYFQNANIYGMDIYETNILEDRIKTFKGDQYSSTDLQKIMNNINVKFDIIIDDGSHDHRHQLFSFMFLEKYLKPNGIYVIEDVQPNSIKLFQDLTIFPEDYLPYLQNNYNIKYFDTRQILNRDDDFMVSFIKKIV
jgi:hypothetical protein